MLVLGIVISRLWLWDMNKRSRKVAFMAKNGVLDKMALVDVWGEDLGVIDGLSLMRVLI
jgi:hypothetical protein